MIFVDESYTYVSNMHSRNDNRYAKRGASAPLFLSTTTLLAVLVCSFPTYSQTVDMSTLAQCIALETEELKLRCFEAIIASGGTGSEEEVTASNLSVAVAPAPGEAVSDIVGEPDPAVTPGSAVNASSSVVSAAESDPDASSTAVSAAVAGTSLAALSNASTAAAPENEDEVGKEHLRQPEKLAGGGDALLRATVVEVTKGRNDVLHFQMDNGQVWRQNEARNFSYPKNRDFVVSISRGVMGDYRLRIGDNGRMVRIRRVK